MRAEVQAELLYMLRSLGRHLAAAALSLHPSRELDALRILTAAAIAVLADAAMRMMSMFGIDSDDDGEDDEATAGAA